MSNIVKRQSEALLGKYELTPNALILKGNVSYEEWLKIGADLKLMAAGIPWYWGDWLRYGENAPWGEKYSQAIEETGLSYGHISNMKNVAEKFEFPRRHGNLTWAHHQEVAYLDVDEADKWLDRAENKGWDVKEFRQQVRSSKQLETVKLPEGKFSVIYADPPWEVGSIVLEKWESPLDEKYPTMSLDEIKALEVGKLAAKDCSLFLWTTHTYLRQAFEVLDAWGFAYHCCITWDKGGGWSQSGFHRRTEFCLYAYRGTINVNQTGTFIPTLIVEPKRKHSQKPEKMYELIESNTPKPRIELFARTKREGWKTWGNE